MEDRSCFGALVRVGGGSVRSLVTLLTVALSATATIRYLINDGVLDRLSARLPIPSHGLDEALAGGPLSLEMSRLVLTVVIPGFAAKAAGGLERARAGP